ncbi:MAG: phosphodiesterase [Solirubrobacterales bacterium]|nr:phosphodiesterase [Solirubrobacterales bacterium]
MGRPFILVQLSDPHIGADWGVGDPVAGLAASVASVRELRPAPDAVLVSGDLVDHGSDAEYAEVASLLEELDAPVYPLPGNHDDRDALRRQFGIPGEAGGPVQYVVDLGPLRVLALDSTRPGADSGELDAGRLAWLEDALSADPHTPTVLAMHHPPLLTHAPALDALALAGDDRAALAEIVARHRSVALIVAGHVHRAIAGELAGRRVLSAPSTYVGFRLDLVGTELQSIPAPLGYVVHVLCDGELVSHVHALSASPCV